MEKLWKWIMRLNAKAFFLFALLLFAATAGFCIWQFQHPLPQISDGSSQAPVAKPDVWAIGTLDFVTNQLASDALFIPIDPFRPTIEAIFTNEVERAAFLKALKEAQAAAAGLATPRTNGSAAGKKGAAAGKKENPFAHLRKKKAAKPGEPVGPDGQPLVIPKLTFLGFFQRPDGSKAAMFHDSSEKSTLFYEAGKAVHGIEILSATVREAEIRFPDGATRKLEIGASIELAPEPAKVKPRPVVKPQTANAQPAAAKARQARRKKAAAAKRAPRNNAAKK